MVDQWLGRVGVLEAFCAVNPKVRLHRASSLPQAEDVFTPELAPGGIVFRFYTEKSGLREMVCKSSALRRTRRKQQTQTKVAPYCTWF